MQARARQNLANGKLPQAAKADRPIAVPERLTVERWLRWRFLGDDFDSLEDLPPEAVGERMAADEMAATAVVEAL